MVAASGCSSGSIHWPITAPEVPAVSMPGDPVPKVQDCITIGTGTPSKYVCGGKVYTAHELRKKREDAAAAASAGK